MNKTWKRKWVKALRSGTYQQGRAGFLRYLDDYCCLGVLCDIVDPGNSCEWKRKKLPPREICETVGLPLWGDDTHLLVEANDEAEWTFNEIADYIEIML